MKFLKIVAYNFFVFLFFVILLEAIFGYWFKKENFGIYMRKERKVNWQTNVKFNNKDYSFFYKRNFWGFRGSEFEPKNVKIVFEGGSTGNQRMTPEDFTIVGQLNKKLISDGRKTVIYNASTDGKSVAGYVNDFLYWFPKIPNFEPEYFIFYIGVNDRVIDEGQKYWDYKVSIKNIDKIKDYVKNNSFLADKYKNIKNKFFPKITSGYYVDFKDLYTNFDYVNYEDAKKIHSPRTNKKKLLIKKFNSRLIKLKKSIEKYGVQPIFITQVMYNGLHDHNIFLINNELKKFTRKNNFLLIPLDEIIEMDINDFYDKVHTTPKGSKKIAEAIYPYIIQYIN